MSVKEEMLQFIDTNVLVYAYDKSAGAKYQKAKELLKCIWNLGTGCISIQVLQEFYVTVTDKLAYPMESEIASRIISGLSSWCLHSPSPEDVIHAIFLHQAHRVSFWDAMIIQSAQRMNCQVLFSEDLNPGQCYDSVRVVNPFTDDLYNLEGKFGQYLHD